MSHYLDQAACSDAQRREDLARNDAAQRAVDGMACRATGNHRSAQNDEPEPTEQDWVTFDCERNVNKGERLAARNDAAAMDLQVQHMREVGAI